VNTLLRFCTFAIALCGFVLCSCDRGINLSPDFSSQPQWKYAFNASVNGSISSVDTQKTFASAASCTLLATGDKTKPGVIHASAEDIRITSNMLDEAAIANLILQAQSVRLSCDIQNGTIVPNDSTDVPMIHIGEWDILRDLAYALPSLPKIKVRKGKSWDRERSMPLSTKYGNATGHLMQTFSLDSIFKKNGATYATVTWRFTYRIEYWKTDSIHILEKLPSKATGTGVALINLSAKAVEHASASFSVPLAREGIYKIGWNEQVSLSLVR